MTPSNIVDAKFRGMKFFMAIFHIDTGTKSVIKMCNFQILQLCVRVPTRIRVPDASHFR
jgi:hypothetical protein